MEGIPIWLIGAAVGLVLGLAMAWFVTALMAPTINRAEGPGAERAQVTLKRYRITAPLLFAVVGAIVASSFFGGAA